MKLILNLLILTIILLSSCKNEATQKDSNQSEEIVKEKSDTLTFKTFHQNFPSLPIGFVLNRTTIKQSKWPTVDPLLFQKWIINQAKETSLGMFLAGSFNMFADTSLRKVEAVGKLETDSCYACLISVYEKLNGEDNFYRDFYWVKFNRSGEYLSSHNVGIDGVFTYQDKSEEAGESYDFEIEERDEVVLIIIDLDSIYQKRIRYEVTNGQDWRVDQYLVVNDTAKLPNVEQIYSVY